MSKSDCQEWGRFTVRLVNLTLTHFDLLPDLMILLVLLFMPDLMILLILLLIFPTLDFHTNSFGSTAWPNDFVSLTVYAWPNDFSSLTVNLKSGED
jgi:hypothetical protein